MEAIGAVASVAQLTNYILNSLASLFDAYQKVRSLPKRIKQHFEQIDRLRGTLEDIQTSAATWKPSVIEHLRALGCTIQLLRDSLEKLLVRQNRTFIRRLLKTWIKDTESSQLESILTLIEADKSSLLLSIAAQATATSRLSAETLVVGQEGNNMPSKKLKKPNAGSEPVKITMPASDPAYAKHGGSTEAKAGSASAKEPVQCAAAPKAKAPEELQQGIWEYNKQEIAEDSKNFYGKACPGNKYSFTGTKIGARSTNVYGEVDPAMYQGFATGQSGLGSNGSGRA